MKKQDIDTNNVGEIANLFKKNLLNRNKNLFTLLNFINGIDGQMILNLDGAWGSGKSVFLKQVEYLSTTEEYYSNEQEYNLYKNIIDKFKKEYYTFYFNSWEHDLYNNPLESLISELLMKIASEYDLEDETGNIKNEIRETLKKVGGKILSRGVKKITAELIELEDFTDQSEDITPRISSINTQKQAINDLIQKIYKITKKRILIIVDELDRCKPSYAVELLEIVKHFFTNNNVVFLFGTNKNELEHTVKTLYGQGFNGYKYLNRFFDFEFRLPEINKEKYIETKSRNPYPAFVNDIIKYCFDHFNFTMRDMNRFYSLFDFFNPASSLYSMDYSFFTDNILIPYAVSLRIHNGNDYNNFLDGYGEESFLLFCEGITSKIKESERLSNDEDVEDLLKQIYSLVSKVRTKKSDFGSDFDYVKYKLEMLTMLSD